MAYSSLWYLTDLPSEIIDIIDQDLSKNFNYTQESTIHGKKINKDIRNSENSWIPDNYWIAGFLWHYVTKANNTNFNYNLMAIDQNNLQYTKYSKGMYYNFHQDSGLSTLEDDTEVERKLSFSLQLSNCDDYEGGNLILINENGSKQVAPRHRGTMILFDSRIKHCVTKVTSGVRKSIVGWIIGPRWR